MSETAVATEETTDAQQVQSVEFPEAADGGAGGAGTSIDILLDMEVPVTVCIGKTALSIQRLLQLSPGSVLKLDQSIDMPVELYLKDSRFAVGKVVVVDDHFAVRITEILSSQPAAD